MSVVNFMEMHPIVVVIQYGMTVLYSCILKKSKNPNLLSSHTFYMLAWLTA